MGAFLERIGIFARSPDARPLAEIAADIDAELAFHVDETVRALVDGGRDPESARAEALERFGDYGRIRRECARTQMGERIVLQRIQIVLTAALIVGVGFLLLANRAANQQAAAERQRSLAVLAALESRLAHVAADAASSAAGEASALLRLRPSLVGAVAAGSAAGAEPGAYIAADGRGLGFDEASRSWNLAFCEQPTSWRHGLRLAERLAALPDVQGAEILASIWSGLPVVHREQAMKPFVFDGGHPNALEVLQLGFEDQSDSVKERAVLYLHTYAWKNLWAGETTGSAWFAEFRDRPVAEVLTVNATRWAREFAHAVESYEQLHGEKADDLLDVAAKVDPAVYAKSNVDLGALLQANGVGALTEARLGLLGAESRAAALRILSWCKR